MYEKLQNIISNLWINKKESKMAKTNFMVLRYNFWRRQKSEKSSSDIN